ncbi:MAG: hypothetical protein K6T26_04405 [Alicyclobacillus sp.]|nr:hypothetical protein [Alicyclobacillus sp.]
MKHQPNQDNSRDDEWLRKAAADLPELPFPGDLAERIRGQVPLRQQRRRLWRQRWTAAGVGGAGLALAALCLVALGFPARLASHGMSTARQASAAPVSASSASASSAAAQGVQTLAAANAAAPTRDSALLPPSQRAQAAALSAASAGNSGSAIGLALAPLAVSSLHLASSRPGGPLDSVSARLSNRGPTALAPQEVVGLLVFLSADRAGKASVEWLTWVNGPDQTLAAGGQTDWSFQPVGAPRDAAGNLQGQPVLLFYRRGVVSSQQADTVWPLAPVQVRDVRVQSRQTWASGSSVAVTVQVHNPSSQPVSVTRLLALAEWPPDSHGAAAAQAAAEQSASASAFADNAAAPAVGDLTGWLRPGALDLLALAAGPGQPQTVPAGGTTTLTLRLAGPPGLDRAGVPRVVLVLLPPGLSAAGSAG